MVLVNLLAVIAYALSSLYIIKKHREYFIFFAFLTFSQGWALVSCFYNDLGVYNLELFRYTIPTYATTRLALFYLVFNFGFLMAAKLIGKRILARVDYFPFKQTLKIGALKLLTFVGIFFLICYIAYQFVTDGIPILSGLDRALFFEQADAIQLALITYSYLFAFFLGYFRQKRGRFSVNGLLLSAYILFAILIGNKFSFLILLLVPYYAPIYIRRLRDNPGLSIFSKKYITILLAATVLTIAFAFGSYWYVSGDRDFAAKYVTNRVLTFQGEMWWAVDYGLSNLDYFDDIHWQTELENVVKPLSTPSTEIGMKYLMIKVLGPIKAYPIIEKGYLYTMTYPAILIVTFPLVVCLIFQFMGGILFFLMLYYLNFSIIYRHTIRAVITIVILIPFTVVLMTGNFAVFFTFGMIIKILTLTVLETGLLSFIPRQK